MIKTVSVYELNEQLETDPDSVLIDVRGMHEFQQGHVPRARNIPIGTMALTQMLAEWNRDAEGKPIYFICQSGGTSQQMLDELAEVGFENAQCVAGGMLAWRAMGLPVEKKLIPEPVLRQDRRAWLAAGMLVMTGCGLGLAVHPGFFAIPVLVAAEMIFAGITGWSGLSAIFGSKDRFG